MRLILFIIVLTSLFVSVSRGQNPIISHIFTSDPAALVYGDSVYLYTGHDEASPSSTGFQIFNWHVFSSADMVNWKDHGPVLSVSDFSWATANAWAGQCIERDGKFYWYVPMSHGSISGFSIGVAVADSPLGPFSDALGEALITNDMTTDISIDWDDIDPAVFIDDDDQAYLFWGNTTCKYIKLKDNMIELDGEIQYVSLPNFTEAPWIHKHNELYYLSYAANYPEEIHYSISEAVTGPWTYKGRINQTIDNSPTNHQSIIEFKDQWYFIYHTAALPTGGEFRRSVAIDYMFYRQDSTILEVVQTEEGVDHADSTLLCPPSAVIPKVKVNDENWTSGRTLTLIEGDSIRINPESAEEGEWLWTGPDEFTSSDREIVFTELSTDQSGEFFVTFTNSCGTKSYSGYKLNIIDIPEKIVNRENYVIRPLNSELAVTVQNGSTVNGTNIIQSAFSNYAYQQWRLYSIERVYWRVSPVHFIGKGLDVNEFSEADGAKVQIWDYWGGTTQQWEIVEVEEDIYEFRARHSGKCLDASGDATTEGAALRQWTCNGSERQQFTLTVAEEPNTIITQDEDNLIKIYPNPVSQRRLWVDISAIEEPKELIIFDVNGRIIYQELIRYKNTFELDLEVEKGVYFMQVKNNSMIYCSKFVLN